MPIEQRMITRMLEAAQKKVEGFHFDTRKHLLEYDDVLNKHRDVIYKKRREVLENKDLQKNILDQVAREIETVVLFHTSGEDPSAHSVRSRQEWNLQEIYETMRTIFPFSQEEREKLLHLKTTPEEIINFLVDKSQAEFTKLQAQIVSASGNPEEGQVMMEAIEKSILLRAIDTLWVDHLVAIDYLRTGIGLRGYGQRDPLVEYKKETYHMFNELLSGIQKEVVYSFYKVGIGLQLVPTIMANDKMVMKGAQKSAVDAGMVSHKPRNDEGKKVGRNDPCPCGSGKKYKKCHGA
jgi:preprotein translocase subunit SecA